MEDDITDSRPIVCMCKLKSKNVFWIVEHLQLNQILAVSLVCVCDIYIYIVAELEC